jgi:hypothetical protein
MVPNTLLSPELDGETTRVPRRVGGSRLTTDGTESGGSGDLVANLGEQGSGADVGNVVSDLGTSIRQSVVDGGDRWYSPRGHRVLRIPWRGRHARESSLGQSERDCERIGQLHLQRRRSERYVQIDHVEVLEEEWPSISDPLGRVGLTDGCVPNGSALDSTGRRGNEVTHVVPGRSCRLLRPCCGRRRGKAS